MNLFEEKMKKYLLDRNVIAEHLSFSESCHSINDAALAVNAKTEDFVKNICMISENGDLIVAIVKGEDRASTSRVGKALNTTQPKIATAYEILDKTGYPCGGTPSFRYNAIFLIDNKVVENELVYTGGGSENSLIKISTIELLKANNAKICRIRK